MDCDGSDWDGFIPMREFYSSHIRTIEDEFGKSFLDKGANHAHSPFGVRQHFVRYHWSRAKQFLRGLAAEETNLSNESLAIITDLAAAIRETRELPNFETEIRPRLKDRSTFNAAANEMLVANACKSMGEVEFVKRINGIQTPDLKISQDGQPVYVECQRKERIVPGRYSDEERNCSLKVAEQLASDIPAGSNVFITIIGGGREQIEAAAAEAATIVRDLPPGKYCMADGKYCIWTDKIATPPERLPGSDAVIAAYLPSGLECGVASADMTVDEHRNHTYTNQKRVQFAFIESHTFKTILNGFNEKRQRGQIPDGSSGVLNFDVDLTHVLEDNHFKYLNIITELLTRKAWQPGINTKIGGFLFTTWPHFLPAEGEGCKFLVCGIRQYLVQKREPALPHWFRLARSDA
jgi:hypothetical protein